MSIEDPFDIKYQKWCNFKVITFSLKFQPEDILSEQFIKQLHNKMFCDVWSWAGKFRKTNKNIGVDKYLVAEELRRLIDDCKFWIENADVIISKIFEKNYFTWSRSNINKKSEARTNYLKAIKKADKGDIKLLIEFARL